MRTTCSRSLILRRPQSGRPEGGGIALLLLGLSFPLGERGQNREIASHHRFLLGARPAFDAPLRCDRFVNALLIFTENKLDGQAALRIAAFYETLCVLTHPLPHRPARDAGIIAAVGAAQNVD